MNRTCVVFIAGNPYTRVGIESLYERFRAKAHLDARLYARPTQARTLTALIDPLDDATATSVGGSLVLVCFSFGCYIAAKWIEARKRSVDAVVFINPTLATGDATGDATSCLQKAMAAAPVVGDGLFAALARRLSQAYVKRCFLPEAPRGTHAEALAHELARGKVWKDALRAKIIQEAQPLCTDLSTLAEAALVLRGEEDAAVDWNTQQEALRRCGLLHKVEIRNIAGAGHALIWTHTDEVATDIERILRRLQTWQKLFKATPL